MSTPIALIDCNNSYVSCEGAFDASLVGVPVIVLSNNDGCARVSRLENEAVLYRMAARLALRPDVLDQRRNSVEHPFRTIKQWMGQGSSLMRRLENVRGEFSLTALAYNIRLAITLIGVPGLIAAARA
jgi:hypothetical protein